MIWNSLSINIFRVTTVPSENHQHNICYAGQTSDSPISKYDLTRNNQEENNEIEIPRFKSEKKIIITKEKSTTIKVTSRILEEDDNVYIRTLIEWVKQ